MASCCSHVLAPFPRSICRHEARDPKELLASWSRCFKLGTVRIGPGKSNANDLSCPWIRNSGGPKGHPALERSSQVRHFQLCFDYEIVRRRCAITARSFLDCLQSAFYYSCFLLNPAQWRKGVDFRTTSRGVLNELIVSHRKYEILSNTCAE